MSEALIGVIIGGVITFFSGFFIELRKQKKEDIKFKIEKIEKLYFEYLNWLKATSALYDLFSHYLKGYDIKTAIDLLALKGKEFNLVEKSNDYNNVVLLINLYFPELSSKFKEIEDLNHKLSNNFIRETSATFNLINFKKNYNKFLENTEKFEKDILVISNRINRC